MAPLRPKAAFFPGFPAQVFAAQRLGPQEEAPVENPCLRAMFHSRPTCYGARASQPCELQ